MTKREGAVISAHTGVLCSSFDAMHEYVEEILQRPVWTHELGNPKVVEEIKEKSKEEFLQIVKNQI